MSSLLCCTGCRRPSPDLPNVRHVSSPSDKSRALLQRSLVPRSTGTVDSTGSEDRRELRRIFDSSQEQSDEKTSSSKQGYPAGSTGARERHRSSTSRLQDVLRKRLSRDSGFSAKSSKRKSKINLSEEDLERRKELKRALHRRLRDELLKDQAASQGGYDPDAEIIATPNLTKSRSGGAIHISPKSLSDIMRRLESSQSEGGFPDLYAVPNIDPDTKKRIGYEHTNASKVTSVWEDDIPFSESSPLDAADEIKQILSSPKTRVIEVVHSIPTSNSTSRQSPLERSDTVIHAPFSKESYSKQGSTTVNAEAPVKPPSPDILPLRMPSITESIQRDWRLSLTATREGSVPNVTCEGINNLIDKTSHQSSRPSYPEDWRVDAVGLLDSFGRWKGLGNGDAKTPLISTGHRHRCDPTSEERDFGGVDGENGHTGASEGANVTDEKDTARSEIVHDQQPAVPTAPKALVSAISLPQLPNIARHSRNKSSGNYSMTYSVGGRRARYSSSSGYGAPVINRSITLDNASSVYTFPGESYSSSPRSSIGHLGNLPDKLKQLQTPGPGPTPVHSENTELDTSSASLGQEQREVSHSRRGTIDTTSFQSSTDSFRARELAAAARIVPKPRTLTKPKISRFKEELIDEAVKVKSLGRKSMLGKGFGKRGNFRSYDGSEEWYSTGKRQGYGFAFVPEEGESAASIWERALKDHAAETGDTSGKQSGSISKAFGRQSMRSRVGGTKVKRKPSTGLRSISTPSRGQGLKVDLQGNQSGKNATTPAKAKNGGKSSPTKSIPMSWSKYPSHTRAERSITPAGKAENVAAHDFVDSPKTRSSFLSRRKKSRSMTFGKNVFKSWSKLYKSYSSNDVKNQARGFRSSTSPGYKPEFPELEVYGLGSPALQASVRKQERSTLSTDVEDSDLTSSQETDVPFKERSAKAWSRLYEDCVKYPNDTDTEAGSVANIPVSHSRSTTVISLITPRHEREVSSNSTANMRESTNDFQRSLRVHEVEARKSVLEAAEKAWAD
ncbi:hypothetical protein MMC30_001653 [Trapelia coarctata]|nr:hypothetical protein [Trapelia coarctata]